MPPQHPEDSDWIETVVKLAESVGLNGMRVRWKLIRMRKSWERTAQDASNETQHLSYEHTVCPQCGRVQDRSSKRCNKCGEGLGPRPLQMLQRIGLVTPKFLSLSTLIGIALLVAYFRVMIARPGEGYFGLPADLLLAHGAYWLPSIQQGEWWRHGTAIFMHIGLWHLGFNLFALAQIGPDIEELFGRGRMVFFFMFTGVMANVACQLWGLQALSAGASGAIMGLIGAAAGWGHRDGTSVGRAMRNRMLRWALYTMIFGVFVSANHIAHAAGFFIGAGFGLLTPPAWTRSNVPRAADFGMGILGLAAAIACTVIVVRPPASSIKAAAAMTQETEEYVEELDDPMDGVERMADIARACDLHAAGQTEAASKLFQKLRPADYEFGDAGPASWCTMIEEVRKMCATQARPEGKRPTVRLGWTTGDYDDDQPEREFLCARIRKAPLQDAATD